jgi:hypothetical protein
MLQVVYDVDPWMSLRLRPCQAKALKKEDRKTTARTAQKLPRRPLRQLKITWERTKGICMIVCVHLHDSVQWLVRVCMMHVVCMARTDPLLLLLLLIVCTDRPLEDITNSCPRATMATGSPLGKRAFASSEESRQRKR